MSDTNKFIEFMEKVLTHRSLYNGETRFYCSRCIGTVGIRKCDDIPGVGNIGKCPLGIIEGMYNHYIAQFLVNILEEDNEIIRLIDVGEE